MAKKENGKQRLPGGGINGAAHAADAAAKGPLTRKTRRTLDPRSRKSRERPPAAALPPFLQDQAR